MYGRRQQQYGGRGQQQTYGRRGGGGSGRFKMMLIIGLGMAAFQAVKFYTNTQVNPLTGESQRITWTPAEEVQLGMQSAPQMAAQHGGLHPDQNAQDLVDRVGERLVKNTIASKSEYKYDFHLLADDQVVNAFALPGGQCFITAALFGRLQNEDQLAGVMGHEIGHVIHRHGGERMASQNFIQGLMQSVMMMFGGDYSMMSIANLVGQYASMKYGRDQELESDDWGVRLMIEAGYEPKEMIDVMDILEEASGGGGKRVPEFQSTHPSPENRREKILESIEKYKNLR